ncbi:FecR domain-containing protein [uncultured Paludibaculum sp.]|uniref:FecR domain-containing protein n=1 Tax=uncultured Paludibaculum sp. TaxID=1765020 RepID=UPI002AAAEEA5|nr:FecR domain-containing protein [uncultured Paludibaculum sp.]
MSDWRDEELERIERALRPLRYQPRRAELEARLDPRVESGSVRHWPVWTRFAMAAALFLTVGASVAWYLYQRSPGWAIASATGEVHLGTGSRLTRILRTGEHLETGSGRVLLRVGDIGDLTIEKNSLIRLLEASPDHQLVALERGEIRASILAPPRQFQVLTPSAKAVDLGCAYTLHVDADGSGHLEVTMGWVSFEDRGRQSFIPVGAACRTRKGLGPGTPYFLDAAPGFALALEIVDFSADPQARMAARKALLPLARRRDALTLWHLLSRGTLEERTVTLDRLIALAPLPVGVTRDAILNLEPDALQRLWDGLLLGPGEAWKLWGFTPLPAPIVRH